jgi:hypothetical protein
MEGPVSQQCGLADSLAIQQPAPQVEFIYNNRAPELRHLVNGEFTLFPVKNQSQAILWTCDKIGKNRFRLNAPFQVGNLAKKTGRSCCQYYTNDNLLI